jgi:hypothetical protein
MLFRILYAKIMNLLFGFEYYVYSYKYDYSTKIKLRRAIKFADGHKYIKGRNGFTRVDELLDPNRRYDSTNQTLIKLTEEKEITPKKVHEEEEENL